MNATYVQYGCGFAAGDGWLNFDASPTLRIERVPLIGKAVSTILSGNNQHFPPTVRFGDIRKGPLCAPGTADGVYASHILEHLTLSDFRKAILNTYEMLAANGVFRLIVPDLLERARTYVATAHDDPSAAENFLRVSNLGREHRPTGLSSVLREYLGNSSHLTMWDETSMSAELRKAGFIGVRRCEKGDSGISVFDEVEDAARFYDTVHGIRECAMEARKPS